MPNARFTDAGAAQIGKVTTAGSFAGYNLMDAVPPFPWGITAGPDGALWFAENAGNDIGRITTSGTMSELPIPTSGASPLDITTGSDGNLWFTENSAGQLGTVTL
ncbi:hypothetical protein LN042_34780 [Kitasatospora sp. RB6PN24]|uniref:Vgb family protein n=1 Tax=Kitasatospora humi TaxID=2893891 RepID=UPI001E651F68|nr:hypothetical protein [Kitasatospora humi]MCC9312168.1 hypothetical protein [Kitasatospora humi]